MNADDPIELADEINGRPRPWLIGVDIDGTLAPIASRPEEARLEAQALEALDALAERVGVMVAVVSGRSMHDLRTLFGLPDSVMLLGSHGAEVGSEIDRGAGGRSDDEDERLRCARQALERVVDDVPGAWIEHKPVAVALHLRQADPQRALEALTELEAVLEGCEGLTLHRGKMVLEAAVRPASKTLAFGRLRDRLEPLTTIFVGDDASDEHVFQSLGDGDISVKVGPGPTAAHHRLESPSEVVQLLHALATAPDRQPDDNSGRH